jgi:cytochrome c biogenesis protein CcdA
MIIISLPIAFIAGMLSLLPACGPALLPGYLGYAFRNKAGLVTAISFFALGFSVLFLPFSLGVSAIVGWLVESRETLFILVGWLLIFFGLWSFFEIRFNGIFLKANPPIEAGKPYSSFLLGMLFGLTSSACTAPIYGAIISLVSVNQSGYALLQLLAFELGLFLPLLILSYLISKGKVINLFRFQYRIPILGITLANLISGVIFISLGLVFVTSKGAPFSKIAADSFLLNAFQNWNDSLIAFNQRYPDLDLWALLVLGFVGLVGLIKSRYLP